MFSIATGRSLKLIMTIELIYSQDLHPAFAKLSGQHRRITLKDKYLLDSIQDKWTSYHFIKMPELEEGFKAFSDNFNFKPKFF